MLNFLTLKPEAFGLDISDISLKIAKLKRRGKVLSLASFGEAEVKPGIIEKGELKDLKGLTAIIKKAVSKVKGEPLQTKYVVASLPEEQAFLQVIQMPKMKREELRKAVYFEAENYVPLPIEQVYFDFDVVRPLQNHLDHFDVFIAALPRKTVDPYLNCLRQAGLIPMALEIESQAISSALIKDNTSPFPVLLVDFGATRTSLIIFAGRSLHFTSSIPISSSGFTRAIVKSLGVSAAQAEQWKVKYGLQRQKRNKQSHKVFEALIPILTDLIEQIKKYLDYYHSHSGHEHLPSNGKGLQKIYLCGGGANLSGLADFLASELKVPTEIGNPWVNILAEPVREVPQLPFEESLAYTTALGLALRGIK